jgi:pimeloyl-ACP methyl ester carboxylesterase
MNFSPGSGTLAAFVTAMPNTSAAHAEAFDSAGVKIHYTITGAGNPVILLHGLSSSARLNWDKPGVTALLAREHQVISVDCRGHGLSGKPEAADAYGINLVEDVVRLMDHLHLARARVAGYSMGGMIALKLITLHPGRVAAAVLGGMGWHRAGDPADYFWQMTGGNRARLHVPAACPRSFPDLAVTEAELRAMKAPVTVIVGDQDPCRQMYVEPLQKVRPDWPVKMIPDAGHMNCVTKTEFQTQLLAALR